MKLFHGYIHVYVQISSAMYLHCMNEVSGV